MCRDAHLKFKFTRLLYMFRLRFIKDTEIKFGKVTENKLQDYLTKVIE